MIMYVLETNITFIRTSSNSQLPPVSTVSTVSTQDVAIQKEDVRTNNNVI